MENQCKLCDSSSDTPKSSVCPAMEEILKKREGLTNELKCTREKLEACLNILEGPVIDQLDCEQSRYKEIENVLCDARQNMGRIGKDFQSSLETLMEQICVANENINTARKINKTIKNNVSCLADDLSNRKSVSNINQDQKQVNGICPKCQSLKNDSCDKIINTCKCGMLLNKINESEQNGCSQSQTVPETCQKCNTKKLDSCGIQINVCKCIEYLNSTDPLDSSYSQSKLKKCSNSSSQYGSKSELRDCSSSDETDHQCSKCIEYLCTVDAAITKLTDFIDKLCEEGIPKSTSASTLQSSACCKPVQSSKYKMHENSSMVCCEFVKAQPSICFADLTLNKRQSSNNLHKCCCPLPDENKYDCSCSPAKETKQEICCPRRVEPKKNGCCSSQKSMCCPPTKETQADSFRCRK